MNKISIAKPHIDQKDIDGVVETLKSGWLSLGPKYKEFEKAMCDYTGMKFACAVSSGTSGLHLAVRSLGLMAGDEVITSSFSFVSSSNCLLYEGVKPVFVDIEETTLNIDPNKIESAITSKTKAILVVHIFGQTAEMDKIMKIARKYKLKIIEDACESIGSTYKGKMAGTFGDVSVLAFYPNKQMTTGEGGMILTNSDDVHVICDSLRNQGRGNNSEWLIHEQIGYNYRMDEMSASLGITQLAKLNWMIEQKREIASWYTEYLKNDTRIKCPKIGDYRTHTWFIYAIRVASDKRDVLLNNMNNQGIQTRAYLPSIHLQPFMKTEFGYKEGDFPITETASSESIALPFYIGLTRKEVEYISKTLIKIL